MNGESFIIGARPSTGTPPVRVGTSAGVLPPRTPPASFLNIVMNHFLCQAARGTERRGGCCLKCCPGPGLPHERMKRALLVRLHITAGLGSLLLPFAAVVWEFVYRRHVPLGAFLLTSAVCLANAAFGLMLVQRRVPVSAQCLAHVLASRGACGVGCGALR